MFHVMFVQFTLSVEHVDQLEWIKTRLNGAADDRDEDGIKLFLAINMLMWDSFIG